MKGENSVFKCEATANSVTGHVCVYSNDGAAGKKSGRGEKFEKKIADRYL